MATYYRLYAYDTWYTPRYQYIESMDAMGLLRRRPLFSETDTGRATQLQRRQYILEELTVAWKKAWEEQEIKPAKKDKIVINNLED